MEKLPEGHAEKILSNMIKTPQKPEQSSLISKIKSFNNDASEKFRVLNYLVILSSFEHEEGQWKSEC